MKAKFVINSANSVKLVKGNIYLPVILEYKRCSCPSGIGTDDWNDVVRLAYNFLRDYHKEMVSDIISSED